MVHPRECKKWQDIWTASLPHLCCNQNQNGLSSCTFALNFALDWLDAEAVWKQVEACIYYCIIYYIYIMDIARHCLIFGAHAADKQTAAGFELFEQNQSYLFKTHNRFDMVWQACNKAHICFSMSQIKQ